MPGMRKLASFDALRSCCSVSRHWQLCGWLLRRLLLPLLSCCCCCVSDGLSRWWLRDAATATRSARAALPACLSRCWHNVSHRHAARPGRRAIARRVLLLVHHAHGHVCRPWRALKAYWTTRWRVAAALVPAAATVALLVLHDARGAAAALHGFRRLCHLAWSSTMLRMRGWAAAMWRLWPLALVAAALGLAGAVVAPLLLSHGARGATTALHGPCWLRRAMGSCSPAGASGWAALTWRLRPLALARHAAVALGLAAVRLLRLHGMRCTATVLRGLHELRHVAWRCTSRVAWLAHTHGSPYGPCTAATRRCARLLLLLAPLALLAVAAVIIRLGHDVHVAASGRHLLIGMAARERAATWCTAWSWWLARRGAWRVMLTAPVSQAAAGLVRAGVVMSHAHMPIAVALLGRCMGWRSPLVAHAVTATVVTVDVWRAAQGTVVTLAAATLHALVGVLRDELVWVASGPLALRAAAVVAAVVVVAPRMAPRVRAFHAAVVSTARLPVRVLLLLLLLHVRAHHGQCHVRARHGQCRQAPLAPLETLVVKSGAAGAHAPAVDDSTAMEWRWGGAGVALGRRRGGTADGWHRRRGGDVAPAPATGSAGEHAGGSAVVERA